MKTSIAPIAAAILLTFGTRLSAQVPVGYPPAKSPYVDLEQSQEFTVLVGQFHTQRDPAGVAPQSGLLVGAHYSWRPGGPFYLISEVARMSSNQNVLNPFKSGDARDLGDESRPLYTADFDLGLGLTGGKSWHHLVPEISTGAGLISDLRSEPDTGGFKFGTRFAFNFAGGIRWVPGGRWQIRADIKDRFYSIAYPEAYYVGAPPIIPSTQAKSFWTQNPAFTLGLSRLF